jgi:hypothetical protein
MEKWSSAFPNYSNHPVWTRPYYGIQYRKNVPKGIHIGVVAFDSGGARAYHIDLYANKHLNMSNFTADKDIYCETIEDALLLAESW